MFFGTALNMLKQAMGVLETPIELTCQEAQSSNQITPSEKNLSVPYDSQRDNKVHPKSSCNVTCLSMCLNFLGYDHGTDPDTLIKRVNSKETIAAMRRLYGKGSWVESFIKRKKLHNIWLALKHVANEIMVNHKCVFDATVTTEDVIESIDRGCPVILGTKLTHSGHLIVAKGYMLNNKTQELSVIVCNDPWGNAIEKYKDHNGHNVLYPKDFLWPKLKADRSLMFFEV